MNTMLLKLFIKSDLTLDTASEEEIRLRHFITEVAINRRVVHLLNYSHK